jgi:hypothetical protein
MKRKACNRFVPLGVFFSAQKPSRPHELQQPIARSRTVCVLMDLRYHSKGLAPHGGQEMTDIEA